MTSGNLFIKIIIFSIPLILSGVLQLLYNASDLIVIGKFGSDQSLAAIGNTGALINLIVNVFMGLSVGANITLAKAIGAKDKDKANRIVQTSMLLALFSGIFLAIFGFFLSRTFLEWMMTPDDVIELSTLYIQIYFIGMPGNLLYNFGAAILRAKGDTKRPLIFLTIAGLINVCLNLFFVIVLHLDVIGVALATIISQLISAILVIWCLIKDQGYARLNVKGARVYLTEALQIARIGLPAGIQGSIFSISNVLIQSSVNSFGSVVMSGNAASQNLEGFTYTAMNSMYHAALSFTSQNIGAKKPQNITKIFGSCLILVCCIGIIMGGGTYLFGRFLLNLYTSGDAIEVGMQRLLYLAVPYFLCGIMDVTCGMIRGMGYAFIPMVVSLLGACLMRVVWIYTVFNQFHTLQSLYISYPISWIITFLVHLVFFFILYSLTKRKLNKAVY